MELVILVLTHMAFWFQLFEWVIITNYINLSYENKQQSTETQQSMSTMADYAFKKREDRMNKVFVVTVIICVCFTIVKMV